MKYLKLVVPAATAVAAVMACLGVTAASATVLCKNNLNTSTCSEKYLTGTVITATLEKETTAVLEEDNGTTQFHTCTESTIEAKTLNEGSATTTVSASVSKWTWGGCTATTDTLKTGELEIHHITGTDNGTLTGKGTEVTTTIFGVSCVYGTGMGHDIGTLIGGNPATLDIHATVTKNQGGFLCPNSATFTAKYWVTSPTPLYVAAG